LFRLYQDQENRMETQVTGSRLHPLIWIAAVAVILLSAAGIGAIFGIIPGASSSTTEPLNAALPAAAPAASASAGAAVAANAAPPAASAAPSQTRPAPARQRVVARAPEPAAAAPLATAPQPPMAATAPPPAVVTPPCPTCGTVEAIREIEHKGEGTGLGAVAGGVAGAVVGSQLGRGRGNTAATVLGTVGGAIAGHQIERSARKTIRYEVVVRYDDGASQALRQDSPPAWRPGDKVRVENNVIMAR